MNCLTLLRKQGRASFIRYPGNYMVQNNCLLCIRCSKVRSAAKDKDVIDIGHWAFYVQHAYPQLINDAHRIDGLNYSAVYEHSILFNIKIKYHKNQQLVEAGLDPLPKIVGKMKISRTASLIFLTNANRNVLAFYQRAYKPDIFHQLDMYRNSIFGKEMLPNIHRELFGFYTMHPLYEQINGKINSRVDANFKQQIADRLQSILNIRPEGDIERQLIVDWIIHNADFEVDICVYLRADEMQEHIVDLILYWRALPSVNIPTDLFYDDFYSTQNLEKCLFANIWNEGQQIHRVAHGNFTDVKMGFNDAYRFRFDGLIPQFKQNVNYISYMFFNKLAKHLRTSNKYLINGENCYAICRDTLQELEGDAAARRYIKEVSIKPMYTRGSARNSCHEIFNVIREIGFPHLILTFSYDD